MPVMLADSRHAELQCPVPFAPRRQNPQGKETGTTSDSG